MEELMFGNVAASMVLMMLLSLLYNLIPAIKDRLKAPIAAAIGVVLGVGAMYFNETAPYTATVWINYILQGFLMGMGATGAYEVVRAAYKPRQ
jgi:hypothetical protein